MEPEHKEEKVVDRESNSETLNDMKVENNQVKDFTYFLWDLIKTGVIVFVIAFCLRFFVVQPFIVEGESMMPNYVNNEYLLAERITFLLHHDPARGDVIVFHYPNNPSVSYIKRVIGLPGETVKIADNKVTITNKDNPSGTELSEDYLPSGTITNTNVANGSAYSKTLGDNEFFVMGDNRQHSSDSREWGILPRANIIGRAWLTLLPAKRFGLHRHVTYNGLSLGFLPEAVLAGK